MSDDQSDEYVLDPETMKALAEQRDPNEVAMLVMRGIDMVLDLLMENIDQNEVTEATRYNVLAVANVVANTRAALAVAHDQVVGIADDELAARLGISREDLAKRLGLDPPIDKSGDE